MAMRALRLAAGAARAARAASSMAGTPAAPFAVPMQGKVADALSASMVEVRGAALW